MVNYLHKYFENGDKLIKVLDIVESDEGFLFICLGYSYNHNVFNLEAFIQKDFMRWYASNEIECGETIMPLIKAKNLL